MVQKQINGILFEFRSPSCLYVVGERMFMAFNGVNWSITVQGKSFPMPSKVECLELLKRAIQRKRPEVS